MRHLFTVWILISFGFGMYLCANHLPIRDEHFPAAPDYFQSIIFLCGEAVLLSALVSAGGLFYKERFEKAMLAIITLVLLLVLYVIVYRSLLPTYLLMSEGAFLLLTVGSIHYLVSILLKKLLIRN